jgi:predicted patatin/cPLA2 family phospholipase
MKKGLVLEGGAMRGLFTVGILDALMENGFVFDGAVGVSAGAVFGCNIKSGQIGRALRYNLAFCRDKRYCGFHSLVTTGNYYNADFCYRTIPHTLDWFDVEAFRNNPMDFYVVATRAVTGDAVYHNCLSGDDGDIDWLRASASMPLASRPVCINGKKYLDGGIADSVPIRFFEDIGYNRNVIILTQPESYQKTKKSDILQ